MKTASFVIIISLSVAFTLAQKKNGKIDYKIDGRTMSYYKGRTVLKGYTFKNFFERYSIYNLIVNI